MLHWFILFYLLLFNVLSLISKHQVHEVITNIVLCSDDSAKFGASSVEGSIVYVITWQCKSFSKTLPVITSTEPGRFFISLTSWKLVKEIIVLRGIYFFNFTKKYIYTQIRKEERIQERKNGFRSILLKVDNA